MLYHVRFFSSPPFLYYLSLSTLPRSFDLIWFFRSYYMMIIIYERGGLCFVAGVGWEEEEVEEATRRWETRDISVRIVWRHCGWSGRATGRNTTDIGTGKRQPTSLSSRAFSSDGFFRLQERSRFPFSSCILRDIRIPRKTSMFSFVTGRISSETLRFQPTDGIEERKNKKTR